MTVLHQFKDLTPDWLTDVLRADHAELLAYGVQDYTWEQLWDDYRLCAIQSLYVPLAWCAFDPAEKMASVWFPMLMFTLDAIDQLGSSERLRQVTLGG